MSRARTLALFVLMTVLFGSSFPAIKAGLAFFPPLVYAAARFGLAAVLLLGYAAAAGTDLRPRTSADWRAVLAGGVLFIGSSGLLYVGQQFVTSGVAAIIASLTPVLTGLFGWVLLPEERLSAIGSFGVLLGFVGVAIVVRPDPANLFATDLVGGMFVLAATALITLGTVLVRRSRPSMPTVALTGWMMALGAALLFGLGAAVGESIAAVEATPVALGALVYLAVFASAVGFLVFFTLLERIGALEVNLVTYLTPLVALVVGRLLLDEPISPTALVGFLVIFSGFVLLKRRELRMTLDGARRTSP